MRCILASDLHLSQRCPVARNGEDSWFEAMARPLRELNDLQDRCNGASIVYAGDIFDKWNASAEVINFALTHLPQGYAVPGQHDLPNHSYEEIERSAYGTLAEVEHIINLRPGEPTYVGGEVVAHGFPWGHPPKPVSGVGGQIDLAVVHAFIYTTKANAYSGAPAGARASVARSSLAGFDVAAYGDNHKGFIDTKGKLTICNCGGFMRRKSDERDYRPGVGLLHGDGTVTRHYLDTSAEVFVEQTEAEVEVEKMLDMTEFMEGLKGLGADTSLEFESALGRFLETNKTDGLVREIVLEAATMK